MQSNINISEEKIKDAELTLQKLHEKICFKNPPFSKNIPKMSTVGP